MGKLSNGRKKAELAALKKARNISKQQADLNAQLQLERDALIEANRVLIEASAQESTTLREKLKAEEQSSAELP